MDFVKLNGVTLHYQVTGDPARQPTIVFSNSLGTDLRIWDGIAAAFETTHAIVRYDKRGHGLSDAPPALYHMDDHVSDLAALIDHVGVNQTIVCGLSVGGMITQGLASARPDRVRALILCDTAHRIGNAALWNERIETIGNGGIASAADGILQRWFAPVFHQQQPERLAGYRNMLTRTTLNAYIGTCAAIRDTDYTQAAQAITVPTMCVVGEHDGVTSPELVRRLADLVPGARYAQIADAAHLPCVEQPARLAALMRDFIAALS